MDDEFRPALSAYSNKGASNDIGSERPSLSRVPTTVSANTEPDYLEATLNNAVVNSAVKPRAFSSPTRDRSPPLSLHGQLAGVRLSELLRSPPKEDRDCPTRRPQGNNGGSKEVVLPASATDKNIHSAPGAWHVSTSTERDFLNEKRLGEGVKQEKLRLTEEGRMGFFLTTSSVYRTGCGVPDERNEAEFSYDDHFSDFTRPWSPDDGVGYFGFGSEEDDLDDIATSSHEANSAPESPMQEPQSTVVFKQGVFVCNCLKEPAVSAGEANLGSDQHSLDYDKIIGVKLEGLPENKGRESLEEETHGSERPQSREHRRMSSGVASWCRFNHARFLDIVRSTIPAPIPCSKPNSWFEFMQSRRELAENPPHTSGSTTTPTLPDSQSISLPPALSTTKFHEGPQVWSIEGSRATLNAEVEKASEFRNYVSDSAHNSYIVNEVSSAVLPEVDNSHLRAHERLSSGAHMASFEGESRPLGKKENRMHSHSTPSVAATSTLRSSGEGIADEVSLPNFQSISANSTPSVSLSGRSEGCIRCIDNATIIAIRIENVEEAYKVDFMSTERNYNAVIQMLTAKIPEYKGELVLVTGDAVIIGFNCSSGSFNPNHTIRATECALEICTIFSLSRKKGVKLGISIHAGPVLCGCCDGVETVTWGYTPKMILPKLHSPTGTPPTRPVPMQRNSTIIFGGTVRVAYELAVLAAEMPFTTLFLTESVKTTISIFYRCVIMDVIKLTERSPPIPVYDVHLPYGDYPTVGIRHSAGEYLDRVKMQRSRLVHRLTRNIENLLLGEVEKDCQYCNLDGDAEESNGSSHVKDHRKIRRVRLEAFLRILIKRVSKPSLDALIAYCAPQQSPPTDTKEDGSHEHKSASASRPPKTSSAVPVPHRGLRRCRIIPLLVAKEFFKEMTMGPGYIGLNQDGVPTWKGNGAFNLQTLPEALHANRERAYALYNTAFARFRSHQFTEALRVIRELKLVLHYHLKVIELMPSEFRCPAETPSAIVESYMRENGISDISGVSLVNIAALNAAYDESIVRESSLLCSQDAAGSTLNGNAPHSSAKCSSKDAMQDLIHKRQQSAHFIYARFITQLREMIAAEERDEDGRIPGLELSDFDDERRGVIQFYDYGITPPPGVWYGAIISFLQPLPFASTSAGDNCVERLQLLCQFYEREKENFEMMTTLAIGCTASSGSPRGGGSGGSLCSGQKMTPAMLNSLLYKNRYKDLPNPYTRLLPSWQMYEKYARESQDMSLQRKRTQELRKQMSKKRAGRPQGETREIRTDAVGMMDVNKTHKNVSAKTENEGQVLGASLECHTSGLEGSLVLFHGSDVDTLCCGTEVTVKVADEKTHAIIYSQEAIAKTVRGGGSPGANFTGWVLEFTNRGLSFVRDDPHSSSLLLNVLQSCNAVEKVNACFVDGDAAWVRIRSSFSEISDREYIFVPRDGAVVIWCCSDVSNDSETHHDDEDSLKAVETPKMRMGGDDVAEKMAIHEALAVLSEMTKLSLLGSHEIAMHPFEPQQGVRIGLLGAIIDSGFPKDFLSSHESGMRESEDAVGSRYAVTSESTPALASLYFPLGSSAVRTLKNPPLSSLTQSRRNNDQLGFPGSNSGRGNMHSGQEEYPSLLDMDRPAPKSGIISVDDESDIFKRTLREKTLGSKNYDRDSTTDTSLPRIRRYSLNGGVGIGTLRAHDKQSKSARRTRHDSNLPRLGHRRGHANVFSDSALYGGSHGNALPARVVDTPPLQTNRPNNSCDQFTPVEAQQQRKSWRMVSFPDQLFDVEHTQRRAASAPSDSHSGDSIVPSRSYEFATVSLPLGDLISRWENSEPHMGCGDVISPSPSLCHKTGGSTSVSPRLRGSASGVFSLCTWDDHGAGYVGSGGVFGSFSLPSGNYEDGGDTGVCSPCAMLPTTTAEEQDETHDSEEDQTELVPLPSLSDDPPELSSDDIFVRQNNFFVLNSNNFDVARNSQNSSRDGKEWSGVEGTASARPSSARITEEDVGIEGVRNTRGSGSSLAGQQHGSKSGWRLAHETNAYVSRVSEGGSETGDFSGKSRFIPQNSHPLRRMLDENNVRSPTCSMVTHEESDDNHKNRNTCEDALIKEENSGKLSIRKNLSFTVTGNACASTSGNISQDAALNSSEGEGHQNSTACNKVSIHEPSPHDFAYGNISPLGNSDSMTPEYPIVLDSSLKSFTNALSKMITNEALPRLIQTDKGTLYSRSDNLLGTGSYGKVFLGMEQHSGRLVAMKFMPLPEDPSEVQRIENEVVTMLSMHDPYLVDFYGYAFVNTIGEYCEPERYPNGQKSCSASSAELIVVVMEAVVAGTLRSLLSSFKVLKPTTVVNYMKHILKGLLKLHSNGITHADLKLQNVLITTNGTCKITDFGASYGVLSSFSRMNKDGSVLTVHGTPAYLAPEAANGHPDLKSDIWSLGIMYLQLVTGRLPYNCDETVLTNPSLLAFYIAKGRVRPVIPEEFEETCAAGGYSGDDTGGEDSEKSLEKDRLSDRCSEEACNDGSVGTKSTPRSCGHGSRKPFYSVKLHKNALEFVNACLCPVEQRYSCEELLALPYFEM